MSCVIKFKERVTGKLLERDERRLEKEDNKDESQIKKKN